MLDIVIAPHPVLKKVAEPVAEAPGPVERALVQDMFETMYHANGIGLAAPQVGVSRRILVMDVRERVRRGEDNILDPADTSGSDPAPEDAPEAWPLALIDPEIIMASDHLRDYEEGCLSLPGEYATISRPETVTVAYVDPDGAKRQFEASGLLAVCVQHEIDHLNGVLFVDHLSKLKRDTIMRRLRKKYAE